MSDTTSRPQWQYSHPIPPAPRTGSPFRSLSPQRVRPPAPVYQPQSQLQSNPSLSSASMKTGGGEIGVQQLLSALAAEKSRNVDLVRESLRLQSANSSLLTELDSASSYTARLQAELDSTRLHAQRYRDRAASYRERAHAAEQGIQELRKEAETKREEVSLMLDGLRKQFVDVLQNWSTHMASLTQSEQEKIQQLEHMRKKLNEHVGQITAAKDQLSGINSKPRPKYPEPAAPSFPSTLFSKDQRHQRKSSGMGTESDTDQVLRAAQKKLEPTLSAASSSSSPKQPPQQLPQQPEPSSALESTSPQQPHRSSLSPYSALNHPSAYPRVPSSSSSSLSSASPRTHVNDLLVQAEREAKSRGRERTLSEQQSKPVCNCACSSSANISSSSASAKSQHPDWSDGEASAVRLRDASVGAGGAGCCNGGSKRSSSTTRSPPTTVACTCSGCGCDGSNSKRRAKSADRELLEPPSECDGSCQQRRKPRSRSQSQPRVVSFATINAKFGRPCPHRAQRGSLCVVDRSRSCSQSRSHSRDRNTVGDRDRSNGVVYGRGRSRTKSPHSPASYPEFLSRANCSYLHTHSSQQKQCAFPGAGSPSSGGASASRLPSSFPDRPCSGGVRSASATTPRDFLHAEDYVAHSAHSNNPASSSSATAAASNHIKPVYSYASHGDLLTSPLSSSLKHPVVDGWRLPGRVSQMSGRSELRGGVGAASVVDPPTPPTRSQKVLGAVGVRKSIPVAGIRTKRDL